jgi:hypothetical protein
VRRNSPQPNCGHFCDARPVALRFYPSDYPCEHHHPTRGPVVPGCGRASRKRLVLWRQERPGQLIYGRRVLGRLAEFRAVTDHGPHASRRSYFSKAQGPHPVKGGGSMLRACVRLTLRRQAGCVRARLAVLGRHIGQCLWGAINATGGHGLIAHHAALVGHQVCATQHFALLVWGGRACGDSHKQDHCASPSHCSLHSAMSDSRAHVLTPSTNGDANPNFQRSSVSRRSF